MATRPPAVSVKFRFSPPLRRFLLVRVAISPLSASELFRSALADWVEARLKPETARFWVNAEELFSAVPAAERADVAHRFADVAWVGRDPVPMADQWRLFVDATGVLPNTAQRAWISFSVRMRPAFRDAIGAEASRLGIKRDAMARAAVFQNLCSKHASLWWKELDAIEREHDE